MVDFWVFCNGSLEEERIIFFLRELKQRIDWQSQGGEKWGWRYRDESLSYIQLIRQNEGTRWRSQ